jgi:hypothetical protein
LTTHAPECRNPERAFCVPLIEGRDFTRYSPIAWRGLWLRWDRAWLRQLQRERPDSLAVLGSRDRFLAPAKIVTRQTSDGVVATFDGDRYHCTNSVHTTRLRDPAGALALEFILGVLNSTPMQFYYGHAYREKAGLFPQVKVGNLRSVPIPVLASADSAARSRHDVVVASVRERLALQRELASAGAGQDAARARRRAAAVDRKIDRTVAALYGLTPRHLGIIADHVGAVLRSGAR